MTEQPTTLTPEAWPAPEDAYDLAPNILREIGWTARTARLVINQPFDGDDAREYFLRKAALLDRIALQSEQDGIHGDTTELAEAAALYLIDTDHARSTDTDADPRGYVRRAYARWARHP
ncbi:hypothetical protein JHN59_29325 [Streptomyces sp. MBT49]|uniref:hypothetical protein n=1 Tax=Streptomyces sp. MBT49 TaxID=1488380 RepID=UPI00190998BD|nr:hypothetical protein [Streptomyces sp. MBT49]MBK3628857.1 hypothetical protein [Streptomyces sp. MBT49]